MHTYFASVKKFEEMMKQAADLGLEATVVGSWTKIGFAARRRIWGWAPSPLEPGSLEGRYVVVTGGTRGIGRSAALALARAGANVYIVGRDKNVALDTAECIRRDCGRSEVAALVADLSSEDAVVALGKEVAERTDSLCGLVHSAGALSRRYATASYGTELTVGVHVLATHLLTALLAPLLVAGAPSAVVWVSSGGIYLEPLDVNRLEMDRDRYRGSVAYARAKRAQVALARMWDERLGPLRVMCCSMHPGWVQTEGIRSGLPAFAKAMGPLLRSPEQGADTVAWLVGQRADLGHSGAFWFDRRVRSEHRWPGTSKSAASEALLWSWCENRTGGAGDRSLDLVQPARGKTSASRPSVDQEA